MSSKELYSFALLGQSYHNQTKADGGLITNLMVNMLNIFFDDVNVDVIFYCKSVIRLFFTTLDIYIVLI